MHRLATSCLAYTLLVALSAAPASAKVDKAMIQRALSTLEFGSKSGDFTTRAMALEGLGHAQKKKALPIVKEGTEDPQWQVRRAAISALVTLKDKSWKAALVPGAWIS